MQKNTITKVLLTPLTYKEKLMEVLTLEELLDYYRDYLNIEIGMSDKEPDFVEFMKYLKFQLKDN